MMLSAISRISNIIFLIVLVLPLSYCVYQMKEAETEGKKWCAETIAEFEGKPHNPSTKPALDNLYTKAMNPKPKFIYDARFLAESNGKYTCSLKISGGTIYEYTSDAKKWKTDD